MNQPTEPIPSDPSTGELGAKAAVIKHLHAIGAECHTPNWDGYAALPVRTDALRCAQDLIARLPEDLSLPECSMEPDGSVSLDWIGGSGRTLTISVGKPHRIAYAWIDGADRGHAVADLNDRQLPACVLEEVRRITGR